MTEEKEKWIRDAMSSMDGMTRAEASPWLKTRILARTGSNKAEHAALLPKIVFAASFALFLLTASVLFKSGGPVQSGDAGYEAVANELIPSSPFNY